MYLDTFITLGQIFKSAADGSDSGFCTYVSALNDAVIPAMGANGWFSSDFVKMQFLSLAEMLQEDSVMAFSKKYSLDNVPLSNKTVKIIAAGNIPLVCFHDIFCVLSAGLRQSLACSDGKLNPPRRLSGTVRRAAGGKHGLQGERPRGDSVRYADHRRMRRLSVSRQGAGRLSDVRRSGA